jgi:uncharacterized protein (TIGR02145 family)
MRSKCIFILLVILIKFNLGAQTVTDIDGNIYKTIKIGAQEWMIENLKTTRFNNGKIIPYIPYVDEWKNSNSPGYCWYDFDCYWDEVYFDYENDTLIIDSISYVKNYGLLYNWYAVNTDSLCPLGWHVPSISEWERLKFNIDSLFLEKSMSDSLVRLNEAIVISGSSQYWAEVYSLKNELNFGKSGFNGIPAGWRGGSGAFDALNNVGYWWSSTEFDIENANMYYLWLDPDFGGFDEDNYEKVSGLSVRCVKDL